MATNPGAVAGVIPQVPYNSGFADPMASISPYMGQDPFFAYGGGGAFGGMAYSGMGARATTFGSRTPYDRIDTAGINFTNQDNLGNLYRLENVVGPQSNIYRDYTQQLAGVVHANYANRLDQIDRSSNLGMLGGAGIGTSLGLATAAMPKALAGLSELGKFTVLGTKMSVGGATALLLPAALGASVGGFIFPNAPEIIPGTKITLGHVGGALVGGLAGGLLKGASFGPAGIALALAGAVGLGIFGAVRGMDWGRKRGIEIANDTEMDPSQLNGMIQNYSLIGSIPYNATA